MVSALSSGPPHLLVQQEGAAAAAVEFGPAGWRAGESSSGCGILANWLGGGGEAWWAVRREQQQLLRSSGFLLQLQI